MYVCVAPPILFKGVCSVVSVSVGTRGEGCISNHQDVWPHRKRPVD